MTSGTVWFSETKAEICLLDFTSNTVVTLLLQIKPFKVFARRGQRQQHWWQQLAQPQHRRWCSQYLSLAKNGDFWTLKSMNPGIFTENFYTQ